MLIYYRKFIIWVYNLGKYADAHNCLGLTVQCGGDEALIHLLSRGNPLTWTLLRKTRLNILQSYDARNLREP